MKSQKKSGLDIHNEIKLITAEEELHNLWKEVISGQLHGLLMNPETLVPYKKSKSWDREKDGVITREFFKWLGNTPERDLKTLALHLLNKTPNRDLPYPKVTFKKPHAVVQDCYSAKEWLERNKRKQAVRKYLYYENRRLGFFDNEGNYKRDQWKAFKKKYNVTKATKELLLTSPREEFFSQVKQPANKNKSAQELSPYAAEFFNLF